MKIVNLLLFALLLVGCAADSTRPGTGVNTGFPFESTCEIGEPPRWTETVLAMGSAGEFLLLDVSTILLLEPRAYREVWRWKPARAANERGSQRRNSKYRNIKLIDDGARKGPAEILEVVGEDVVYVAGDFAGVIDFATGETVLRFGGNQRQFEVEYDVDLRTRDGVQYQADNRGVTVTSGGSNSLVPDAELWACDAHELLVLVSADGTATELREDGAVKIGHVHRTEHPNAMYSEGGELQQIAARGTTVVDSRGTCWTAPLPIEQVEMTTTGFAALTPHRKTEGENFHEAHFYAFGEARDVAPCRRVTSRPRLVDIRPEPEPVLEEATSR